MRPEVEGIDALSSTVRQDFAIEHWNKPHDVPTYCGVRSAGWMYVRYLTGEEELYHEPTDPYELNNEASTDPVELDAMRQRAQTLCTSAGVYLVNWPFSA